jgi:uncharacterized membrane protein YedE/YeeE
MQALASFLCGLIFGLGLMISGMTQPAKVLGFLDIFGRWDPTLAFVMAGALAISSVGYALARRQTRPVIAAPTSTDRWSLALCFSGLAGASLAYVRDRHWKISRAYRLVCLSSSWQ